MSQLPGKPVTWKAEWSTLWHLAAMESEDHGDSPLTPHH